MINLSNESGKLFIGPSFCDPVSLDISKIDKPEIRNQDSSLMGYFGYVRNLGTRIHSGYDYYSPAGSSVFAVFDGEIVQIRVGPRDGIGCEQKRLFDQDHSICFSSGICSNCNKKDSCYGVQLWLEIKLMGSSCSITNNKFSIQESNNYLYAYYAHLSKLDDVVLSAITADNITKNNSEENVINFINPPKVSIGTPIGKSGCTGNAYSMTGKDQHLHFECRKEIESPKGFGTRISPNTIVNTKFFIVEESNPSHSTNKVTNAIINQFLEQEKARGEFDETSLYNDWIEHIKATKKSSRFINYCKEKTRKIYDSKKPKETFDEKVWNKIVIEKWKNFQFTEDGLADEEKEIWKQFKREEYPKFVSWMDFQKKHKIIVKKTDFGIVRL